MTDAADPVLPTAQQNIVKPKEPVIGRVVTSESCMNGKSNSFCRHVAIDVSGTPLEGNFLAGQSFGVIAPGVDEKGKPHAVRLYSISTPSWGDDGNGCVLATTVKRLIDERWSEEDGVEEHRLFVGVCSNYLCDINVGTEVQVSGPNGKRFLLPVDRSPHDYLLIATGTGIAPFRGMVMELLEGPNKVDSRVELVMGSPYTSDLMYDDDFRRMEQEHDNFRYHTVISREKREGGKRGLYVHQYIEENLDHFGPMFQNPRTLMYMCGLIGMQWGIYPLLAANGLHEGFMTIKDELAGIDPSEWDRGGMRRYIKPTHRFMLEVY